MGKEVSLVLLVILCLGIISAIEMPQNYEQAKALAAQYGINESELNSLVQQYVDQFGCSSLELYKDQIIGSKIPDKVPYKNEIINLYVANESFGNLVIEEGIVTNFSCEESAENTYNIYIKDYSVLMDFAQGVDVDKILEKINSGDIIVKGVGFGKKIKWFFSKLALKWFM